MFKPQERAALDILRDELGLVQAIQVGAQVQLRSALGEPFSELEAPSSRDEALSRQQIGPAIVLYRTLRKQIGQQEALEIVERVVIEGAVLFLSETMGRLERDALLEMDDDRRESFVRTKGKKFFNATLRWEEISEDEVYFTVTHCMFPDLCEAVGVPELAPLFCKGDFEFFGGVESDVRLERPHTIAQGADTCPFHIYLDEPAQS
jgi:predicted ArsR family transcriptional regulator